MTITEFKKLLEVKYLEAEVRRTARGLAINYTPNGRIYDFHGTHEDIAIQLKLVELWYVECVTGVVARAFSADEANQKAIKLQDQEDDAIKSAWAWSVEPRIFTIRRAS